MRQQNTAWCAAVLAIVPGLLSIKEGGSVLLGMSTKAYTVLPWLVWYNVIMGCAAVIVGIGIGKLHTWGEKYAVTIVTLHGFVLMILLILLAFNETVAINSIIAMLFRTAVWFAIVVLVRRKNAMQNNNG